MIRTISSSMLVAALAAACSVLFACAETQAAEMTRVGIGASAKVVEELIDIETVEPLSMEEALDAVLGGMSCAEFLEFSNRESDVDRDGVPDFVERSVTASSRRTHAGHMWLFDPENQRCDCEGALSCWLDPDTDDDGVIDGPDGRVFMEHGGAMADADGSFLFSPLDTDGDGLPDVRDADSDDDGAPDGVEDRTQMFFPPVPHFLMFDSGADGWRNFRGLTGDGSSVECKLDRDLMEELGVHHDMYLIAKPGIRMTAPLRCTNEWLGYENDFNGRYEQYEDRSDARNPDTDGDGFCDDIGPACGDMPYDECPGRAAPDSADGC